MTTLDPSYEHWINAVGQRHRDLTAQLDRAVRALVHNDAPAKKREVELVVRCLGSFSAMLHGSKVPPWFGGLDRAARKYLRDANTAAAVGFVNAVRDNWVTIRRWTPVETSFNLDERYQEVSDELDIPALFDVLIEKVEAIIRSGEVDSVRATKALESLLTILRKGRNGNYLSKAVAVDYAAAFFKNLAFEFISDSKVAGPFYRAARKTVEDLRQRQTDATERLVEIVRGEMLPELQRSPELKQLPPAGSAEEAVGQA